MQRLDLRGRLLRGEEVENIDGAFVLWMMSRLEPQGVSTKAVTLLTDLSMISGAGEDDCESRLLSRLSQSLSIGECALRLDNRTVYGHAFFSLGHYSLSTLLPCLAQVLHFPRELGSVLDLWMTPLPNRLIFSLADNNRAPLRSAVHDRLVDSCRPFPKGSSSIECIESSSGVNPVKQCLVRSAGARVKGFE
jgi:hypothetical protein